MRSILAHTLAPVAATAGGAVGVLTLAKGAGRLAYWHCEPDDFGWMISIREGPVPWQAGSVEFGHLAPSGAACLPFALFGIPPTPHLAATAAPSYPTAKQAGRVRPVWGPTSVARGVASAVAHAAYTVTLVELSA